MSRAMIMALAVLIPAGAAAAPAPVSVPVSAPPELRRITKLVGNMDRSLALYRDVLGMSVEFDTTARATTVAKVAGEPNALLRMVRLRGSDPRVGLIEFLQWLDPPLPAPAPYARRLGIGSTVLVMNVPSDGEGRCARLAQIDGVSVLAGYAVTTYPGRGGAAAVRAGGCKFFDPDGMLVELSQVLP